MVCISDPGPPGMLINLIDCVSGVQEHQCNRAGISVGGNYH